MENGLPVQAFAPGRSAGVQIGGPQLSDRMTWSLGAFRTLETPTVGDQSSAGGRAVGRVTWLPEDNPPAHRLTHLGVSASLLFSAEDVRYQSRPECHLAPAFVDTGAVRSSQNSVVSGVEVLQILGPWTLMGEALLASVRDRSTAVVWGGYMSVGRFLTDVTQPYDRTSGRLARFETPRPFSWSARTFGTLRAAARLSYLDLEDGNVAGGRETNVTADLTWFLNHYLALRLEYGFAAIRERPNDGNLHFVQARFQVDFY
ncbi:MAG TPA: porin, partial [Rhizomicrobium sp.]